MNTEIFNKTSESLSKEFRDKYEKIMAEIDVKAKKAFKAKEITGLTGYYDPENSDRGMIQPEETIFVEDVKVKQAIMDMI